MKKNLLSIIILALLIVNIVVSTLAFFSIATTNKKTAALVDNIAMVLNLELTKPGDVEETVVEEVSMANTEVYDIEDQLTIPLKKGEDGKDHYALVTVSLALNMKHKDYKTYSETVGPKASLIKGEINDVYSSYTKEEAEANKDEIAKVVLSRIQGLFDSTFIYRVVLTEVYQ